MYFEFRRAATTLIFVISISAGLSQAQNIIRVPTDKPTIQAAILSATAGDTVLVSAGTYREKIDFSGKAITVKSVSGADSTTIDGGQNGVVVNFSNQEGRKSVLQGFTIQNGSTSGISVSGSSPSILSNRIINNKSCEGGGIAVAFGSPLIQYNTISNNTVSGCGLGGGGICVRGDSKT